MHKTPAAEKVPEQAAYAHLDAIILASCYLDALTVFRYGELTPGKNFIHFLQTYPDDKYRRYYQKVSSLYFDLPHLNARGKPQRFPFKRSHKEISEIRTLLYGTKTASDQDLSIDEAANRLRQGGIEVDPEELNHFSYAAYFEGFNQVVMAISRALLYFPL